MGADTKTVDTGPLRAEPSGARPSRGEMVGRDQIDAVLGAGAMGTLYGTHAPDLDRRVAIKLMHPEQSEVAGTARLVREGQALARLSHPNVVSVYEAGHYGHAVFIAMELVDGMTLGEWFESKPRWEAVVDVFIEAARGLAAVHNEGIVHRDFKSGNVTIARDGAVKVLDFGLAQGLGAGASVPMPRTEPAAVSDSARLTRAGTVVGTSAYMAAEQFNGESVDHHADQHAFFVSLYEALYGRRPSTNEDVGQDASCGRRG